MATTILKMQRLGYSNLLILLQNNLKHQHDSVLLLKPEQHCLGCHMQIAVGLSNNGITLPLILQRGLSSNDHFADRTLLSRAQEYMKNYKKALSIAMLPESRYKDYTKSGNLSSGMVYDDYLKFVRLKMYNILVNNTIGVEVISLEKTNDTPDEDARCESRTMPDTRFFPGFFVFATQGPIVADESMICFRSGLLMTFFPTLPVDKKKMQDKVMRERPRRQIVVWARKRTSL